MQGQIALVPAFRPTQLALMFEARAHNPALAAMFILCATAFIAIATLLAKALGTATLGPGLPALQISHGRFLFAFILVATTARALKLKPRHIHWKLHAGRTSIGWLGVTLMFASVAFIPVADATAISFLNPVFCMMLAIPLLGEKVGPIRWSAALIALIGAVILLRPTPASFQPAALLALGAAMAMGLEVIIIRKLATRESPLQILLINNFLGMCIATLAVLPVWQMPTLEQWLALAGCGISMATAQACFVNGMARADASFAAPFSYATLIFAALWDGVIFGSWPDWISLLGAGIILTGGLILALREARLR